jgi:uncharacterized protein YjiS (DUF1127 family)
MLVAIHPRPGGNRARAVGRQHALDALSDAGHWMLATLREWGRRSRERKQLAQLDSRMLADIGMTHADRDMLVNKPFWRE